MIRLNSTQTCKKMEQNIHLDLSCLSMSLFSGIYKKRLGGGV
jgi:hypothetical protein